MILGNVTKAAVEHDIHKLIGLLKIQSSLLNGGSLSDLGERTDRAIYLHESIEHRANELLIMVQDNNIED